MQVVLGLGTNLGDREGNLARALDALERLEGTELLRLSNIYETDPFDVLSQQDDYLNCCVLLETSLKPQRLLEHCLEIEQSLGRVRLEYHGARTSRRRKTAAKVCRKQSQHRAHARRHRRDHVCRHTRL